MFTRKKSLFQRKSFYLGGAAAIGAVFLLFTLISGPKDMEAENINTDAKQPVSQSVADNKNIREKDDFQNSDSESNNNVQENQTGEYYLVKEEDGAIKVYKCDSEGNEALLKTTNILFSLLGSEDQELFSRGVTIDTEDELLELLQDFES